MTLLTSLAAYYRMENSGTDELGVNGLTLVGNSSVSGILNNATSFSSTGYAVRTSFTGVSSGTGPVSISFWAKGSSWGGAAGWWLMVLGNTSNTNDYVIALLSGTAANQCAIYIGDGTSTSNSGDVTTSLNNTTWTHYVITRNGTAWAIYQNGSLLSSSTFTNRTNTAVNRFNLKSNLGNGSIAPVTLEFDELGIWNKELTSSEVSQLYNGGAGLAYPFSSSAQNALFFGGGF